MNEPLISVIVPVYNVEKYLPDCLDSIKNQTYTNLEILLIDDGSTDSSVTICEDYAKKDSRTKVYHKENGGLSDARNYGIERASGQYFTFIDSDDYIIKDYVSYLLELAQKNEVKIAIGSHTVCYESGKNSYKGLGEDKKITISSKEALEHILLDDGIDLSAWAKLYSAELFKEIRYPKGLAFEDTATTYKLIFLSNKIAYGGKSIYNYRIRSNSITTSGSFKKKMQLISNTQKMCDDITSKYPELETAAERRLVWAYFSTLNQLLKCPDRKEYKKEENEIVHFLKSRSKQIKSSAVYSKRDKLASFTLKFGISFYKFAWDFYSKLNK